MFVNYRPALDWILQAFGLHEIGISLFTDEEGRVCIRTNLMLVPRRQLSAAQEASRGEDGLFPNGKLFIGSGNEEGGHSLAEWDEGWASTSPRAEVEWSSTT